ncbi:hypothetical protein LAZ67_10001430, partial [Cordylochernes scorpioides]
MEQLLAKTNSRPRINSFWGNERKSNLHRLPKLELPKFGGEAREWLQFWSAFQSVHDDDSISACVKFQNLQNCMIKGSVSEEIVSSFPNSAVNYPLAISTLKERFGREDMLVEVYVRDLIAIIMENAYGRKTTNFSTLYVRLSSRLRALGSLGVTKEKCAAILYPMVKSALPEDLFVAWERTRHHHKPDEDGSINQLGWTVSGKVLENVQTTESQSSVLSCLVRDATIKYLWRLDVIGIMEPMNKKSKEELSVAALEHFNQTVKQNEDGRYSVNLPWIGGHPPLPNCKLISEKKLESTTERLEKLGVLSTYHDVFKSWEDEGIIERVESESGHVLSHHGVIKPESQSTPVRPVFNASFRTKGNPSLNDCLEVGPNMLENIPDIITRFLLGPVAVTSDIRKAFLQIEVAEEDKLLTVLVVQKSEIGRKANVPSLSCRLWGNQVVLFFSLRTDELTCDLRSFAKKMEPGKVTRRKILSTAHSLFDSIGFACPFTIIPKMLLQESYGVKAGWDTDLSEDISRRFNAWLSPLTEVDKLKIPRCVVQSQDRRTWTLHILMDSSNAAFSACAYLRNGFPGSVQVQLLMARSRVAPMKNTTIPRLELVACEIGSRLAVHIKSMMEFEYITITLWTDSTTALAWIECDMNWSVFVAGRVKKIRQNSSITNWRHVPGKENLADILSRGASISQLITTRWWEGPVWPKKEEQFWTQSVEKESIEEVNSELRKAVVTHFNIEKRYMLAKITQFSNYHKILRMVAYWRRFLDWLQRKEDDDELAPLTPNKLINNCRGSILPEADEVERDSMVTRYRNMQACRDELRARFTKEYLAMLVHHRKAKKSRRIEVGEIVLIGNDQKKRISWPLGKVEEVLPGADGQ